MTVADQASPPRPAPRPGPGSAQRRGPRRDRPRRRGLAGRSGTLAEVDEFLRSPAGHAAVKDFYQARGSEAPGFEAGNLIDAVGFTALWLRLGRQQAQRP